MRIANLSRNTWRVALTMTLFCLACSAFGSTIIVNSTADTAANDGICTLREAIIAANTNMASGAMAGECAAGTAGLDTIAFNIAGAGIHTITPGAGGLPPITEPVLLDGYSQTGASVNTLAVGDNAVLLIEIDATSVGSSPVLALTTGSSGSTIKGLVINRNANTAILVQTVSGGNTISGNFIGTNPAGTTSFGGSTAIAINFDAGNGSVVGGTTPAARNVLATSPGGGGPLIDLEGGTGNLVQGNYLGVNAAGTAALGAPGTGIILAQNASGNTIGGSVAGARNVIASFAGQGIRVGTTGDTIQGNFIGTNATGTAVLGGGLIGIAAAAPVTIGGSAIGAGNLISGASTNGIFVSADVGTGWVIQGNKIGTDVTGTSALANSNCGILAVNSGGLIGGTNTGEGNIIAFNGTQGVTIGGTATGWVIVGNSIFDNVGMGIALRPDSRCDIALQGTPGQTAQPNDACDPDTGPNNLQNYPVITSVTPGATTNIQGTLNSVASRSFRIELFSSPSCDVSGFGEGKTFLGSTTVTTAGSPSCNAAFNVTVPFNTSGQVVTATATLIAAGAPVPVETSEFSACVLGGVAPTNTPTTTPTATLTPAGVATPTPTPTPTSTAIPPTPTLTPTLGQGPAVVVPTLSFPMLALLALALVGAGLFAVRRL